MYLKSFETLKRNCEELIIIFEHCSFINLVIIKECYSFDKPGNSLLSLDGDKKLSISEFSLYSIYRAHIKILQLLKKTHAKDTKEYSVKPHKN